METSVSTHLLYQIVLVLSYKWYTQIIISSVLLYQPKISVRECQIVYLSECQESSECFQTPKFQVEQFMWVTLLGSTRLNWNRQEHVVFNIMFKILFKYSVIPLLINPEMFDPFLIVFIFT